MVRAKTENFLKFLGTAGARFVMIKQLRASGGIWIAFAGTNILIDPGPGSLVKLAASRPKLDPGKLEAIILTHRHLDHANDINVVIEGMTEGGFKKRGVVFLPSDCLEMDPVILRHTRTLPEKMVVLKAKENYQVGNIEFSVPLRHIHPVETYGLKFKLGSREVSLISDTRFFNELIEAYRADTVIINTVFLEPRPDIEHLSLEEAKEIILNIRPRLTVLSHFGMSMLKAKPYEIARQLSRETGLEILAASDGLSVPL
ncbi:MAG: MBL fold metallo-hydrolase [Candidatus Omnitrophota bacterium]